MRLRQLFYGAWVLLLMVGLLGCGTEPVNQAGPAAANETKVYRWKLITTWPKNLPGLTAQTNSKPFCHCNPPT